MTKTEYTAAIETDLKAANALCTELRTLRNFKKIAQTITGADKMVSFEVLDKTITGKEAELQKLRSSLGDLAGVDGYCGMPRCRHPSHLLSWPA